MTDGPGWPRREPGPLPTAVWLGVSDAELLRYLRLALEGAAGVRECEALEDADVAVVDSHHTLRRAFARPVLCVGGRGDGAGSPSAPRVAHLRSPFNTGQLLGALADLTAR